MLCNIVMDGLQDFIQDNLPVMYKRPQKEIDSVLYKLGKKSSNSNMYTYLKVFCIRYVDNILILGNCLKQHINKIHDLLLKFLSQRGLEDQKVNMSPGACFKPGTSFDYLSFTFKYPNVNSKSFNKGKYTKLEYNPMIVARKTVSKYSRSGPYLMIKSCFLKNLKNCLKVQLSKKYVYLSVKGMIDKLNNILRDFLNYYNLTNTIIKQLLPLNNLLHKLFYKYLLRKFSSSPKIYRYIKTNYIDQNRFKIGNTVLLRVTDIKPLKSGSLVSMAPSDKFLRANTYIDQGIDRKNKH